MRESRLRFTSLRLQEISRGRSRPTIFVRGGTIKLQPGYIALWIGDFIYANGVGAYSRSLIPLLRTKRSVNVTLETPVYVRTIRYPVHNIRAASPCPSFIPSL